MSRYADKATDSVRDVCCETVAPSVRHFRFTRFLFLINCSQESEDIAFFVLCLSNINVEALDMELLMYHFLKVSLS